MRFFLLSVLFLVGPILHLCGQTRYPYYEGGGYALATHFYQANYTPAQRDTLAGRQLDFVFSINAAGIATLVKVYDIDPGPLLDTLWATTDRLPPFVIHPDSTLREPSTYFLQIGFPSFWHRSAARFGSSNPWPPGGAGFQRLAYTDFEELTLERGLFYLDIGCSLNAFAGSASRFLNPGGGARLGIGMIGPRGWGGALQMEFYANKSKRRIPVSSAREQFGAPQLLLVGLSVDRLLRQDERGDWRIRLAANIGQQNISPSLGDNDDDWVRYQLPMIGMVLHRGFLLGKPKVSGYAHTLAYGQSAIHNAIDVGLGIYPYLIDIPEIDGVMPVLTVTYRFAFRTINSYRLKEAG